MFKKYIERIVREFLERNNSNKNEKVKKKYLEALKNFSFSSKDEDEQAEIIKKSIQRTTSDFKAVSTIDGKKAIVQDNNITNPKLNSSFGEIDCKIFEFFASQGFIGYQACAIIAQNGWVNKVCTIPCQDAIRPGYEITPISKNNQKETSVSEEDINNIYKISDEKYGLDNAAIQLLRNNKIFGQSLAFFVIDGIDYSKPFNIDGVKPNSYKGISIVEPYWLAPELDYNSMNDPSSVDFYVPTYWRLPNGMRIHKSHCIRIINDEVSDILKPTYFFGGIPLTQQIYERVYAAEKVANEAPLLAMTKRLLIADANLEAFVANQADAEKTLEAIAYLRDNFGVFIKNPEGSVTQIDTNLSDFDALIMTQFQLVASLGSMTGTKLLKTTPKGFNSNGDYETKDYAQECQSLQEKVKPLYERHILLLAKSNGIDEIFNFKFNAIDMPTEKEIAETREIEARRTSLYVEMGAITNLEARKALKANPNSGFNNLSDEIEETDDFGDEF